MRNHLLVSFLPLFLLAACQQNDSSPASRPPHSQNTLKDPTPSGTLAIDWSQPPVACAEEVIPHPAQRVCLDLSTIKNVYNDWPETISPEDKAYWLTQPRGLTYCRASELLRREELLPGTYKPGEVETAWMRVLAIKEHQTKLDTVLEASSLHGMPPQVLTGALFQESLFSQLGIAQDGGNYSCGIGQVNISEWCNWAIQQPEAKKIAMRFPLALRNCNHAQLSFMKPFYEIALTRLNGLPEYRLMPEHFENIELKDVVGGFTPADPLIQQIRFDLVKSFLGDCRDARDGILSKANQLALIYRNYVPNGLKGQDLYSGTDKYQRRCQNGGNEKLYPLNTGWLLAVGIYNAGPRAVDALAYYNWWSKLDLEKPETFKDFNPVEMVSSFYWGGTYNAVDDRIHFTGRNGADLSWEWFKGCVLQRHIARVAQHVTLPGTPRFIDSLENGISCKRSSVDPGTGTLVSGVPDFRKVSSGRK